MKTHILNFQESSHILGRDLLCSNLIVESCKTRSIVIVCTEALKKLYGQKLLKHLQTSSLDAHLITFGSGESFKTRQTKTEIEDQMLKLKLGKDTTLIALGGGVTTDLVGFLASTYCRGIPFISVPTSLLAMVDASVGGKTGVNTPYGKNLIGSFYLPVAVVIDYALLDSLPAKEMSQGLVELIKAALIYDKDLFLETQNYLDRPDPLKLVELIYRGVQIKLEVVQKDFKESRGLRHILNFGHTIGHALECFFDYELPHGEAVAVGMIAEAFMACELNILPRKDFHQIVETLLPLISQQPFNIEEVIEHMAADKKSKNQEPRFVMIQSIGQVDHCNDEYCQTVDLEVVRSALKFVLEVKK